MNRSNAPTPSSGPATRVRCPSGSCAAVFELPVGRLGRSERCPECGVRMTARPLGADERLREQERRISGGRGSPVERLSLAVVVDNVRSLWNVGSIFRTADACGVRELVLTGITGCPPRPEISKTALGAEEAVTWSYRADTLDALQQLRDEGYAAVAIESSPQAVPLQDVAWPRKVCLVLGNEVAGVSERVLEVCDRHVGIPMYGVKDSFNVAVAFGIVAHQAARSLSRRAADEPGA